MSHPNFVPTWSTTEIYRDDNLTICLEDDLDDIENAMHALETAVDGKASTSHTHSDYAAVNHTHTGYADSDHDHDALYAALSHAHDYINKTLQMTADSGDIAHDLSNLDILSTIGGYSAGMTTAYCPVNSTNAPNSNEAWRFLTHKMSTDYGWVLGFGSYGSMYANYINNGTWRGWKNLVDGTSAPIWIHESNSGYYMIASQTVTPSKALDQCRNGWLLMWSDYDPSTSTANNADICTTLIPKRGPTGSLWSGQGFLCAVSGYQSTSDDTDIVRIKRVYVHNDKLVGHAANSLGDRNDIVLRAIYEY